MIQVQSAAAASPGIHAFFSNYVQEIQCWLDFVYLPTQLTAYWSPWWLQIDQTVALPPFKQVPVFLADLQAYRDQTM